jgi:hypothetical protein
MINIIELSLVNDKGNKAHTVVPWHVNRKLSAKGFHDDLPKPASHLPRN